MRKLAAQVGHVFARVDNRLTDLRAELDDRLVHLGFDLLFERDLAALENFLDMRAQFARLRIDNREFLFDAESVSVVLFHPDRDGSRAVREISAAWASK